MRCLPRRASTTTPEVRPPSAPAPTPSRHSLPRLSPARPAARGCEHGLPPPAHTRRIGLLGGYGGQLTHRRMARVPTLGSAALCARADNIGLGTACGKMFRCGVVSIVDAGDSDIIKSMPEAP